MATQLLNVCVSFIMIFVSVGFAIAIVCWMIKKAVE